MSNKTRSPFQLTIIVPVYNDFESFEILIRDIDECYQKVLGDAISSLSVLIVDDGSTVQMPPLDRMPNRSITRVEILRLATNIGHQRAICVGLAYMAKHYASEAVLVMDTDGEDRPTDSVNLVKTAIMHPDHIILAQREKRSENLAFRFGYIVYKILYRWLCGIPISHGNFSLIPAPLVYRLAHVSEIWNHFAAGVLISNLPLVMVPTMRGKRYIGTSHMGMLKLIIHGMSAISVSTDRAAVRVLIGAMTMVALAFCGFLTVSLIRIFTDLAIPGWASILGLSFLTIALQGVFLSVLLIFIVLNRRQQLNSIPIKDFERYVERINGVEL